MEPEGIGRGGRLDPAGSSARPPQPTEPVREAHRDQPAQAMLSGEASEQVDEEARDIAAREQSDLRRQETRQAARVAKREGARAATAPPLLVDR